MTRTAPDIAAQARELSLLFLKLSMATDQFRHDHFDELSATMRAQLKDQAQHLDDLSDHFTAAAIGAILKLIQDDLDNIKGATQRAQQAIATIQKIEKVASIVSAGVALGAAIFAGNPGNIGSAVTALSDAIMDQTAVKSAS
jgi:hypothetical protein